MASYDDTLREMTTKTGCRVRVWWSDHAWPEGTERDPSVFLHLSVDFRHAELMMTTSEAKELSSLLADVTEEIQ